MSPLGTTKPYRRDLSDIALLTNTGLRIKENLNPLIHYHVVNCVSNDTANMRINHVPGNSSLSLSHRAYWFNGITTLNILTQHLESDLALRGRVASLLRKHIGLSVILV